MDEPQESIEGDKGKLASKQAEPPASPSEEEHSNRYFIIAVAVLVAAAALVFAFRFASQPAQNAIKYNGFLFEYGGGLWNTQWQQEGQLYNLRLHYHPGQVDNISISGGEDWNASGKLYITFDPEGKNLSYVALSAAELSLSLYNALGVEPAAACTRNVTDACFSRPIVSCENPPDGSSVIYLKDSGEAGIILDRQCAIIQGTGSELVRASERAIYQWYGIIRKA